MDLGDLVFFLIFIIIIITNIIGQVKKSRRPPVGSDKAEEGRFESKTRPEPGDAQAMSKTGWRQVLDDIITDVREQAQARQGPGVPEGDAPAFRQPSGWDLLMGQIEKEQAPKPQPRPKREAAGKPDAKIGTVSPVPASGAKRMAHYSPAGRHRPERSIYTPAYWSDEQRATAAKGHYRGPACRRIPLHGLRNAIIWHEILSPPVALRDTDSGNLGGFQ